MTDNETGIVEIPHGEVNAQLWLDIAYDISTETPVAQKDREVDENGEIIPAVKEPTVKWLAEKYNLTPKQALGIIAHPKFTEFIHGVMRAIAKVGFDRKAYNVLDEIMEDGNNRERIAAIKVAAELLGYKQASAGINLNFNFDKIVRNADDGGKAIDVEAYPGL